MNLWLNHDTRYTYVYNKHTLEKIWQQLHSMTYQFYRHGICLESIVATAEFAGLEKSREHHLGTTCAHKQAHMHEFFVVLMRRFAFSNICVRVRYLLNYDRIKYYLLDALIPTPCLDSNVLKVKLLFRQCTTKFGVTETYSSLTITDHKTILSCLCHERFRESFQHRFCHFFIPLGKSDISHASRSVQHYLPNTHRRTS